MNIQGGTGLCQHDTELLVPVLKAPFLHVAMKKRGLPLKMKMLVLVTASVHDQDLPPRHQAPELAGRWAYACPKAVLACCAERKQVFVPAECTMTGCAISDLRSRWSEGSRMWLTFARRLSTHALQQLLGHIWATTSIPEHFLSINVLPEPRLQILPGSRAHFRGH